MYSERTSPMRLRWLHGILFAATCLVTVACEDAGGFERLYHRHCAVCHGTALAGAAQGPALVGVDLAYGGGIEGIARSIAAGMPEEGMPSWSETLSATEIRSIAIFIAEERANTTFADFRIKTPLTVPTDTQRTREHDFRLDTVIDGLDPLPYSIAPLPDGRILLTEKMRGLSIVSAAGEQSDLVPGAPKGYRDAQQIGPLQYGLGWILDVALHPDYEDNGWVYLSYGDRCENCNRESRGGKPVSMIKLIRGRLVDGEWADQETIWQVDVELYNSATDLAAGGRICFDGDGHVFLSVGMKSHGYRAVQNLEAPDGKVHRMHDDGRVPTDNPFVDRPGALPTIWTYGHRSPHGLEFNPRWGELWSTEMGPRGGDEVNRLLPGRNYGWPLTSKGVHYNGRPVDGLGLGIDFDIDQLEQPVVDLTPSVAVSSFIFYEAGMFPRWRDHLLVGSLKGSDLYRFAMEDGVLRERETVIEDLARIRDIDVGADGEIYLLLEHASGGQIVRMTVVDTNNDEERQTSDR